MKIPDSPFIQAKMSDELTAALNEYCKKYGLSRSEAVNIVLSEKFGVTYAGSRTQALKVIEQQQAEIERLKQELEATRRRQRLATVQTLGDKFTMEEG